VLTAIWAPELALSPGYEQLAAGVVAIAVGMALAIDLRYHRCRLASLHLFHWLL